MRRLRVVAETAPGALFEVVGLLPSRLRIVTQEAFLGWLAGGTDMLCTNRVEEGVRFLLGRSRESRQALGISSAALDDIKGVLRIYAASLAERELAVLSLDSSSFGASVPYTDGRTMFLPPEIRAHDQPERNEGVYTLLAAHQAAAIAMGTFGLDLSRIDFADELRDRYASVLPPIMLNVKKRYGKVARSIRERSGGVIEVAFASGRRLRVLETEHEKLFYSFPVPAFARELFSLVEGSRIQRALSRRYPGLAEDFARYDVLLWHRRPRLQDPGKDAGAQFRVALECLLQFSLLGRYTPDLGGGVLAQRVGRITSQFEEGVEAAASVEDSARVCFRLCNLFQEGFPVIAWCDGHDVREVFRGIAKQEISPEIVREVSPEMMKGANENRRPVGLEGQRVREIDITERTTTDAAAQSIRESVASGALRVYRYPEFDATAAAYRPAHCVLFERVLPPQRDDAYRLTVSRHRLTHERMRKRFLAMRPEGVELTRRWLSGDEIHLGDAVDYCIDLRRGASPEETIYFRKVTNRRDIIVAVLLDASSSTDEEVSGQRIIETEKAALSILASALSKIGDDFGLFSYFSLGRHKVFFEIVKDFDEPWDERAQGRIASIRAQASNRDGCVIRHATARLAECPHRTKVLLLLSDGVPADVGYGGASSAETTPYAIEDTRRAILECRLRGIVPYCITIDRSARDYIAHLYGDCSYTVIDEVALLPERLARTYLRFTA